MSKDCKDTLQMLKTVTKRECDAKWEQSICQMRLWAELSRSGKLWVNSSVSAYSHTTDIWKLRRRESSKGSYWHFFFQFPALTMPGRAAHSKNPGYAYNVTMQQFLSKNMRTVTRRNMQRKKRHYE